MDTHTHKFRLEEFFRGRWQILNLEPLKDILLFMAMIPPGIWTMLYQVILKWLWRTFCYSVYLQHSQIDSHLSANLTQVIYRPPDAKVQNKTILIPFKPFSLAIPRDRLCPLSVDAMCVCVCVGLVSGFCPVIKAVCTLDYCVYWLCVYFPACALCACIRHCPWADLNWPLCLCSREV